MSDELKQALLNVRQSDLALIGDAAGRWSELVWMRAPPGKVPLALFGKRVIALYGSVLEVVIPQPGGLWELPSRAAVRAPDWFLLGSLPKAPDVPEVDGG